ncbi:PREDICTED: DC-STAMP domain-containing protein 1 [Nanorana parkeri]|uniref:DC-STAMP domain-containing protein 1 n=1 Tax=Nanorana parkeri TaxID=125878 RepID=UPI000854BE3B|nr:PREDICTED: DC-STAMP domain-containing protein 1 [Nanorana parkeri]
MRDDVIAHARGDITPGVTSSTLETRDPLSLKRFADLALPRFCSRYLFSEPQQFPVSKFFFGFGIGGLLGIVIYLFLIDPLTIPIIAKTMLLYLLAATFASGWGSSAYFRCSNLIIVPNMLGTEGRAFLLILVIAAIYAGPGANLQHNFSEIPRSIGCTVELQINNTKMLWKILSTPVKNILRNVVQKTHDFENIGDEVKSTFQDAKQEVEGKSGYDNSKEEELKQKEKVTSTQKQFDIKNILRCEYVIELGITKCYEWFDMKHKECMDAIVVPIISHILCIPMQFSFLCNILNMGELWCKKYVPMEAEFGGMYDKANMSVNNVGQGLSSLLTIQKDDDIDAVLNITEMTLKDKILTSIEKRRSTFQNMLAFLNSIMTLSFVFVFISAFKYTKQYNSDIRHDNYYVTTYFRQIDARRRKLKKRYILPLKKGEMSKIVFPFSPAIQGPEMAAMMIELRQCILPIIMLILVSVFDKILFNVLDVIRRHSSISYVFASYHKLEVLVGGDTLLANILRKTIGLLNSTSNTFETSSNEMCLPNPIEMSAIDHLVTCAPVLGLILLSVLQVFFYRLRRVVASYFFPKREKRRVLFFYNEQLRKRAIYADVKRKMIMSKARINRLKMDTPLGAFYRHCKWLRKFIRRYCIVCNESETKKSYVCPTPDCGTIYCHQCWRDMKKFCFACTPYEEFIHGPDYSDSEYGSD